MSYEKLCLILIIILTGWKLIIIIIMTGWKRFIFVQIINAEHWELDDDD